MPSLRTVKFVPVEISASGDNTIIAADARNKIKVVSYVLIAAGAVTVRFKSGAGTNLSGPMALAANGGLVAPAGADFQHLLETAINAALVLNLGGAIALAGHIGYILDPS